MKECYEVKEMRKKLQAAKQAGRFTNYRITKNAMVDVYGTMPNTNQVGWYTVGNVFDKDALRWYFGE